MSLPRRFLPAFTERLNWGQARCLPLVIPDGAQADNRPAKINSPAEPNSRHRQRLRLRLRLRNSVTVLAALSRVSLMTPHGGLTHRVRPSVYLPITKTSG